MLLINLKLKFAYHLESKESTEAKKTEWNSNDGVVLEPNPEAEVLNRATSELLFFDSPVESWP